ncbi:MAG: hypothetical protein A4E59_01471 [Syntrophorhabdus sp. PtaB.Bin027]|jgi:hypothetical protein|nr:MAG: hypothetical protein A4E59_01471 [Syntrophorhabdus sp. PtaB.Bin027]HII95909.1 hypothetical protein [Methanofastidiosum sp.]
MSLKSKLINYITLPDREIEVDKNEIMDLKDFLKDFNYSKSNDYYSFIYENIEIIISRRGTILISLNSSSDLAYNIFLLSKLANKINSVISIDYFSEKIHVHNITN